MSKDKNRIIVGLLTILACFVLIGLDGREIIDLGKFGYAGIGAWVTLILQFYFRKSGDKDAGKTV